MRFLTLNRTLPLFIMIVDFRPSVRWENPQHFKGNVSNIFKPVQRILGDIHRVTRGEYFGRFTGTQQFSPSLQHIIYFLRCVTMGGAVID